ncbi:sensor histidine kinase [Dyadobacter sp. CY343]|uniref:sensor histidine kinase n=1 Tax=Dyadobacter sp. CY343 TaxID=2907299 RepID=UPI001F3DB485|nr:histidine kinase [Dyadobacter sp. CY343]MCE7059255.1 histidine kinase [Dyadobacter sp. CY343]
MNSINQDKSFFYSLFFPRSTRLRVFYHISFWILFILLHNAYAIPTLASKAGDPRVSLASFLYFFKMIPEYYVCVGLYSFLSKHLKGLFLGFTLLVIVIVITHFFSLFIFLLIDNLLGLQHMPVRFQLVAGLYMDPFDPRSLNSWLVFLYDISEIELLLLPAAFKVAKYAVKESTLRQKLQNEALSMELRVLKTQINPHFVFNVLNAAYAKILPISEEAGAYLQKASEIMRFALYETNDEFIKLEKEISYLSQYVELESIRSNKRCKITFRQEGDISEKHMIPTLLLITLVENAFKHGVHATRHNSHVDIRISVDSDSLEFEIANSVPNQPAMRDRRSEKTGGIGLVNLEKRMKIYYPGKHQLIITEQDGEFKVLIRLPLNG